MRVGVALGAVAGDAAALQHVAEPAWAGLVAALRLEPALALTARRLAAPVPERWERALRLATTGWLLADRSVLGVRQALAAAEVPWVPIKGVALGERLHSPREVRPTSDLDILVPAERFAAARRALEDAGWRGHLSGPRAEHYLRGEGYAWQAGAAAAGVLEVHFRFWGAIPERFATEVLSAASPAPPDDGLRMTAAHAFCIGAVHAWTDAVPRALSDWRDLERLAALEADGLEEGVVETCERWSLALPVALSAILVERLWASAPCARIAARLRPGLRRLERRLVRRLEAGGADAVSWQQIVLARLLSRRPSRMGWRSVWRQVWAHPAHVAQEIPAGGPWPVRRARHVAGRLGLGSGRSARG